MEFLRVPEALQGCDHAALQDYVKDSIINFTSQPAFGSLLNLPPDAIKHATLKLLQQQSQPGLPLPQLASLPTPELASPLVQQDKTNQDFILAFRHDCLNVGCADFRCQLCTHAQARRCSKTFCTKYLVGDALKAECGAPIRVEAIDKLTGQAMSPNSLHRVKLDAVLLNGRSIQVIKESTGGQIASHDLENAALPTYLGRNLLESVTSSPHEKLFPQHNHHQGEQGHNLNALATLTAEGGGLVNQHTPDGRVILPFRGSEAIISSLMVTGSSEGILMSQRPQFILLLRAIDAVTLIPLPSVPPLLSEGFVVATSRVRTAAKKTIPHVNDHVSKLISVGKATIEKLKDLKRAAIDGGCPDLQLPLAQVHTVAEFRQLIDWAVQDKEITNKVKRILKLATGWDAAREHAATAVQDDNCLRAWRVPTDTLQLQQQQQQTMRCALVYASDKGVPLLSQGPIALLEMTLDRDGTQSAGGAVLKPLLKHTNSGVVGWALDSSPRDTQINLHPPLMSSVPPAARAAAPPFPSTNTINASHAAWYQPQHPGWISLPLPLTAEFLRGHVLSQSQHPSQQGQQYQLVLSSQLMALCTQYFGRGIQAGHDAEEHRLIGNILQQFVNIDNRNEQQQQLQQQQQQQQSLSVPPLPPHPPPPPLFAASQAGGNEEMPSLSSMLQSFPSVPHPELLSRLLSSLPSFDSEQAAAAAAAATAAGGGSGGGDALFPAVGGSGNSGNLFRGLTPDWGKLSSLSPQEWQQLLQITELSPAPGGSGELPPSRPSSDTAADSVPLKPPSRSVSAAKSTFSGKLIEKTNEPSPFNTTSPSQTPLPPLPPLPQPSRQQHRQKKTRVDGQEDMLGEEPSLKLMLSMDEICGAGQVLASAKKRQSEDREVAEVVVVMEGANEGEDDRGNDEEEEKEKKSKGPKQRRLSLP